MKKFVLLAVAALMAVTATMAKSKVQSQAKKVARTAQAQAKQRPTLKFTDARADIAKMHQQLPKTAKMLKNDRSKKTVKAQTRVRKAASLAKRRAAGIIVDQPAGTYYNMNYATAYMGYSLFGLYDGTYDAALGEVVEGSDGNLYIHNMLTEFSTPEGYWVKAEKVDGEADTYVIHEQPIYVENYYGTYYTYSIMKVSVNADGQVVPASSTDIKVTWKDHVLRTAAEFNGLRNTAYISAIDDSDYWSGAMNWDVTMTVNTETAITELPAGVEAQDVVVRYNNGQLDENDEPVVAAHLGKLAVSGSDVYLQYYQGIDSWIKGTLDGDKVTFASGQYLGGDQSYKMHAYFMAASMDEEGFLTAVDNITFDYDADNMRLSNSGLNMLVNGGNSDIYWMAFYGSPEIYKFVETAATPATPSAEAMSGYNYMPDYGYGFFDFTLSTFSADGEFINPDKLYYRVYIGTGWEDEEAGEHPMLFTFTPDDYAELADPMTDVPYTLSSSDFWSSGDSHEFSFYLNIPNNIGIQAVYKGGNEEHASEIAWGWSFDNNKADGGESLFPHVADAMPNTTLADGEIALNLGSAAYGFGSGLYDTETFDVAMKVEDSWISGAKLSGKKISAISVPFFTTEGVSDAKVWLSTTIALDENGQFVPDIVSKDFTLTSNGYTKVTLDEPVEIPAEGGIYIGYSFTQAVGADVNTLTPIVLTEYSNVGGFLIHSDNIYRLGWASMQNAAGDLAIEAVLTGGEANAAEIETVKDTYLKVGESGIATAEITNYGYAGLQSAELDYNVRGDGVDLKGSATLTDLKLPRVFGAYTQATINVPAVDKTGDFINYYDITKANGEDNAISDREAQNNVFVKSFLPKKRPLLEEYTGTWCGYCPRGFVALEKMAELYPEDFVALSYHNEDPMEVTYEYPSTVDGFPAAYMDRDWNTDAYYGNYNYDFGIEQTWKDRCQEFGVADIDVQASWSEDMKTINVKSTTTFAGSEEYANYAISYAVVADGLTGTGDDWAQSNYYSGEAPMLYMDQFINGEDHITGLTFNDVLVASAPYEGVEGSLPETIAEGQPYTHEYSFNIDDIVNTAGEPVIQDKSQVKVVAMLVNWGNVANANKCKVASSESAINDVSAGSGDVVKTQYYDLAGRRVLLPSGGIYVRTQQLKNGQSVTRKVVIK